MKKLYKYYSVAVLSGIVFMSLSANAQHQTNSGGGGGGGSHPASSPAPSSGGGGHVQSAPSQSYSRPAASQNYSRPANGSVQHAPVRTYNYNNGRTYQRSGSTQRNYYSGHPGVNNYQGSGSVYGHNHAGISIGVRAGYLPGHAYYHYNQGSYSSYYAPRLGFSVGFLPYGYYPFWFGDDQYYYSGGYYYQYANDQYTVVEPPVGAEVTTLPANAQSIVINGQQYYEVNGVYYEPITRDDGTSSYQVAGKDGELNTDDQSNAANGPPAPQMGDIIPQLPPNCRKINMNGDRLYLSPDGVYYKAVLDQDNNKVYKIVGLPADDDHQQGVN